MSKESEYIKNILLEIVDRPHFWLNKDDSNKFNIQTFDSKNATLAFLKEYNKSSFVKTQKIILNYNNKRLHLIVRHLEYENIKEICNTTVEFIYRRIIFSQIKWPKILINNQKESKSEETIDHNNTRISHFVNHPSVLSNTIEDSQNQNYQSINNFQKIIDQSLTLGHTNDEKTRFQTIHLNQNGINVIDG